MATVTALTAFAVDEAGRRVVFSRGDELVGVAQSEIDRLVSLGAAEDTKPAKPSKTAAE